MLWLVLIWPFVFSVGTQRRHPVLRPLLPDDDLRLHEKRRNSLGFGGNWPIVGFPTGFL